jgi:hypothetical protein
MAGYTAFTVGLVNNKVSDMYISMLTSTISLVTAAILSEYTVFFVSLQQQSSIALSHITSVTATCKFATCSSERIAAV